MFDITIKNKIQKLLSERNFVEAKTLCVTLREDNPDDLEAHIMMGEICGQSGDFQAAEQALMKAFSISPNDPSVNFNLGLSQYYLNKFNDAVEYLARAAQFDSQKFDVWYFLGMACEGVDNKENAMISFEKALSVEPDSTEVLKRLGKLYLETERWEFAAEALEKLFKLQPADTDVVSGLCMALVNAYQYERLLSNIEPVAMNRPLDYISNYYVAQAYLEQAELTPAEKFFNRVLAAKPDHVESIVGLVSIKTMLGKNDEALTLISPLVDSHANSPAVALCFSLIGPRYNREKDAIRLLIKNMNNSLLSTAVRAKLAVTLGRIYEKRGKYEKAFELFKQGNEWYSPQFDCDSYLQSMEFYKSVYGDGPDPVEAIPVSKLGSNKPIFIVGIPRSGTSLVEQILASHPDVFGAGELKYIQNYTFELNDLKISDKQYPLCLTDVSQQELERLAKDYLSQLDHLSSGEQRVTDKMPLNYQNLGLIYQMFPDAKIINCVRDPMDTCMSCYSQFFSGAYLYTFDFSNLGFVYRAYEKLMRYWKKVLPIAILDVKYEDIVENQEAETRKILEYCGLPWADECINFHNTKRTVATASTDQVTKPLYKSSIGKWRHYEKHLGALIKSLKDNKDI